MVWLPGTISIAWTALKALDPGANTLPPTATPVTAITATMAAGKTMPNRRIRPRLRRLLRAPVRCRDKAILSSGHARQCSRRFGESQAFRPRAFAAFRRAANSAAPDLVRRLSPRASTAGGQQCQKARSCAQHFGKKSRGGFTETAVTMITRCYTLSNQCRSESHPIGAGWRDLRLTATVRSGCFPMAEALRRFCAGRAGGCVSGCLASVRPLWAAVRLGCNTRLRNRVSPPGTLPRGTSPPIEMPAGARSGAGGAGWGWRAWSGAGARARAVRDGDLFVETHKAIDFRLSEPARRCPLEATVALVRRGI